jgi:hypothetical protein
MGSAEIDAISGATPRNGDYFVYWDFTDRNGNPVAGEQFRFFIEGTMNNHDDVLYTGIITVGDEVWEDIPIPVYRQRVQGHDLKRTGNILPRVKTWTIIVRNSVVIYARTRYTTIRKSISYESVYSAKL